MKRRSSSRSNSSNSKNSEDVSAGSTEAKKRPKHGMYACSSFVVCNLLFVNFSFVFSSIHLWMPILGRYWNRITLLAKTTLIENVSGEIIPNFSRHEGKILM